MGSEARLVVVEERARILHERGRRTMRPGDPPVTIGRESDIAIADDPLDGRVSRLAVTVERSDHAWVVSSHNANGVEVHPWGMHTYPAAEESVLTGARIALRVRGEKAVHYWILLEDEDARLSPPVIRRVGISTPGGTDTELDAAATAPTAPQQAALGLIFAHVLSWPPVADGGKLMLKNVANALHCTVSAVQERLDEVRARADREVSLRGTSRTDMEYLIPLVALGYVTPDAMSWEGHRRTYGHDR